LVLDEARKALKIRISSDPKAGKYKLDEIELKAYLTERLKLKPGEIAQRFKIPVAYDMPDDPNLEIKIVLKKEVGRALVFQCVS